MKSLPVILALFVAPFIAASQPYTFSTGLTKSAGNDVTNNLSTGVSGGQTLVGSTSPNAGIWYKATSGIGGAGADHVFTVGNNGALEAFRINYLGNIGVGTPAPAAKMDVLASGTALTSELRGIQSQNTGISYNTSAGAFSNYTGYFKNTATRSSGANVLTNVALYAAASGAQVNYAGVFSGAVNVSGSSDLLNQPFLFQVTNTTANAGGHSAYFASLAQDPTGAFHLATRRGETNNVSGSIMTSIGLTYSIASQFNANSEIRFHRGAGYFGGFMSFTTNNGSEAMRIDANKNVGIGTTSPTRKVHISTSDGTSGLRLEGLKNTMTPSAGQVIGVDPEGNVIAMPSAGSGGFSQWLNAGSNIYYVAGGVGIGTSAPAAKLHVASSAGTSGVRLEGLANTFTPSTGQAIGVDADGNIVPIITGGSGSSQWLNNGFNIYYGSGKVGVGTANPSARVDVLASGTAVNTEARGIQSQNTGITYNTSGGPIANYTGYFSNTATRASGSNPLTNVALYAAATGGQYNYSGIFSGAVHMSASSNMLGEPFPFQVTNTSTLWGGGYTYFASLAQDHTGQFHLSTRRGDLTTSDGGIVSAIGLTYVVPTQFTTNTEIRFHRGPGTTGGFMSFTTGNGIEAMRINASRNVGIGTIAPTTKLHIAAAEGTSGLRLQGLANALPATGQPIGVDVDGNVIAIASGVTGSPSQWTSVNSDIFYNSGKVGIGNVDFATDYALAVNGTIVSKKIKVTPQQLTTWPDYVFDSSYQLPKLDAVEAFIQKNKHLPDVPSATEVRASGIDLGDNQTILLKKIEELTLYIIQSEKRMNESEKQLRESQQQIKESERRLKESEAELKRMGRKLLELESASSK